MGYKTWLAVFIGVAGAGGGLAARPAGAQTPFPVRLQALANTTTTGNQDETAVAVDPNGNFLVVWRDEFLDGSASAIIGRRFSSRTGQPLSGEFLINVTTAGDQRNPAIAMANDGRFVVIWEGPDTAPPVTPGIFGSLRAANGTAIVAEFPVNTSTAGFQRRPAVAMQPGGAFLVAWQDDTPITRGTVTGENIAGRIYPANFPSAPPSNPFLINVGVQGDQEEPAAAAFPSTNSWLVGWQGPRQFSPPIPLILVRLLDANGNGPTEFEANTSGTAGTRAHAALAANAQGDAVVVWEAPDQSHRGIFARRFVDGIPSGPEEQINLTTDLDEREPSVAIDQRGGFVTVWVATPLALESAWEGAPEGSPIVILGRKRNASGGLAELLPPPTDAEFQINTSGATFRDPWVAAEPRGNFVVAWQGTDEADPQGNGVFYRGFLDALFADDFETSDTSRWSAVFP
ncbi:MAG: hypothetical protein QG573_2569 [Acidobacteriota bacterium]|nr:hypothetical protein [Acidobacteriota bacterium]